MLAVLAEYDSNKLGGNSVLIVFEETWLASNSCRELLRFAIPPWIATNNQTYFHTSQIMHERIELCCHCACEFDSQVKFDYALKARSRRSQP